MRVNTWVKRILGVRLFIGSCAVIIMMEDMKLLVGTDMRISRTIVKT
jgi:hypothetical protein